MNRKNFAFAIGNDVGLSLAVFDGGGDGLDLVVPTNELFRKLVNTALSGLRTGEGQYECTLQEGLGPPRMLAIVPVVEGPDGYTATVATAYDPAQDVRMVVIVTRTPAGVIDDLPATSRLKLLLNLQDSLA